jgi:tripartite-type tricarboxylate transporter receptor subunit TctC
MRILSMHRRNVLKGSAAISLSWNLPAFSQSYPSQRIRIIVASAPGAVTDTAGRAVAEVLTRKYGQPVVVENRPGAGGLVGLQVAAQAKADGYTLATGGLGNHVIPPVTIRNLPFDIVKAFVPIAQVAEFLNVLVVGTDSPYHSVSDLLRAGKAASGRPLSYASVGAGTSSHLTSELFAQRAGLKLHHVPYGNISTSLVDITGGSIDFGFANLPPTLPLLKSGKLKAIGISSAYRSRHLPEVPTVQEQGVADFDVSSWMGIYGQADMPHALVHELGQVISEGLRSPEHQEKLSTAGFEPNTLAADAFAERNRTELVRWAAVARAADISVEYGG